MRCVGGVVRSPRVATLKRWPGRAQNHSPGHQLSGSCAQLWTRVFQVRTGPQQGDTQLGTTPGTACDQHLLMRRRRKAGRRCLGGAARCCCVPRIPCRPNRFRAAPVFRPYGAGGHLSFRERPSGPPIVMRRPPGSGHYHARDPCSVGEVTRSC